MMLATVRESYTHVYWPGEVIESFIAADVITGRRRLSDVLIQAKTTNPSPRTGPSSDTATDSAHSQLSY